MASRAGFAVTPTEAREISALLHRRLRALVAEGESARPYWEHLRGAIDALDYLLGDSTELAHLIAAVRD